MLAHPAVRALIDRHGKGAVTDALRDAVARARDGAHAADEASIVEAAGASLSHDRRGTLVSAINATGVVLHTNLGRAPLGREARESILVAGSGYSSLELDLSTGERGSRHVHASARLRRITGADDALVANNAAAALLLALSALARTSAVIVSRGELVEIGGAFRIPDIVATGGARLVEVGTTNRTRIDDYRRALESEERAILLKVHRSNFAIVGFTEEASIEELVALGRSRDARVVYDLGSGLLVPGASIGLPDEPDVPSAIRAGADVVVFSGDKLLGGPQAGLAVGRGEAISAMRKHPLMRAVRGGKLVLAALDATLGAYERGAALSLPTLSALSISREAVRARAARLRELLEVGEIVDTVARVGAGAQPMATLPSCAVRLAVPDVDGLAARLRAGTPAVVGRIEGGALLLDLRAVDDETLPTLAERVSEALAPGPAHG
ncbi:MAG: L-seryl-tRNA(Sec) selenium transferase [Deltaproteobacteria bacterium]|nr:L-seryl-tRNA(Sec) selenium transferase [Deltaproteobacteria bacterium]